MKLSLALVTMTLAACASSAPSGNASESSSSCPAKTTTLDFPGLPGADAGATGAGSGALTQVTAFDNPGGLEMFVYTPAKLPENPAVVVAMHGCTQSASAYVAAGWNAVADRAGFIVVYPQQTSANDLTSCFRWWLPAQTTRDQGEARSIKGMVDAVRATHPGGKAFVTGLSAGAAMTVVMLAAYPDVFEAGAVMSGLPYACATTQTDAYACMNPGKNETPEQWAALVPAAARATPPRVSVWHGDSDYVVNDANEEQTVRQWLGVNGLPETPAATETVGPAKHVTYANASGEVRVESWLVTGMSHGVALDPSNGCGVAGAYLLDEKLCSTTKAAQFFGLLAADGAPGSPGVGGAGASSSSSSGSGSTGGCD